MSNVPAVRNIGQILAALGPQSPLVGKSTVDPRSLAAGIKSSFGSLTFKGKTWGIRHRGNTSQLLARDPSTGAILGAIPTVDVVIVKTATAIGKTYYIEKYKEGDFNPPDCWSTNGQVPDPAAPHKQNPTCRGCKWDAFGSRTMDDGRKGKACADSKRLAVVPAGDLRNEAYGGPMLLKLPPSGFGGLADLEQQLHMQGYVYFGLVTRLSFDHQVAYPKIDFTPIRVLNNQEVATVLELQSYDVVDRILSEELIEVSGDPGQPVTSEVAPRTTQPVQQQAADPGPMPAHLVRTPAPASATTSTPTRAFVPEPPPVTSSAPVPGGGAQVTQGNGVAATAFQGQTPSAPETTTVSPELARIRELEAQLAAATKSKRKRSAPVTPTGPQPNPVPVQQAAGQANDDDVGDDEEGDAPADLESKIDALLQQ